MSHFFDHNISRPHRSCLGTRSCFFLVVNSWTRQRFFWKAFFFWKKRLKTAHLHGSEYFSMMQIFSRASQNSTACSCAAAFRAEDAHGCVLWIYAAFLPLAFPGAPTAETFGVLPAIAGHGRGRKIYTAFSYRPPLQSFFFNWILHRGNTPTSRTNESHHPKTPTNPGAIRPNLDGRTSPLWLCRVRSEFSITRGLRF